MKRMIEFSIDDSENTKVVCIEVDALEEEGGVTRVARSGEIVQKAKHTFDMALERIKPVAEKIITKLNDLSSKPEEIEVEFGIKLNAEAGAIVASAGTEANFKVKLSWKSGY